MAGPDPQEPDINALWDYDDPAGSERKFRVLLAEGQPKTPDRIELLTQIARAQGLQRKFEDAHRTLDEAERLLTDSPSRARVRYLLERGRVFNSSGHPEQAKPLFLAAWGLASAAGEDFYAVDAAHMLAIVEPPERQLEWHVKGLALAEQSRDPRARNWLGSLYNNLGWMYHDLCEYAEALEIFEKALLFREAQGRVPETRIAKWCVARALRSLGRLDESLAKQEALLAEHEQAGSRSGYVFEELGECLLALNRPEAARPYFVEAYAELSQDPWLAENDPQRLERLKSYAGN